MVTPDHRRSAIVVFIAITVCVSVFAGGIAVAEDDPADSTVASNHVTLDAADVEGAPGETVELEFTIENTGNETAAVDLDVSSLYEFGDNITVESFDADNGTWYESDRYWSAPNFEPYQLEPGETQSPTITVTLASDAGGQSFDVEANVLEQNASDVATVSVSENGGGSAPGGGDDSGGDDGTAQGIVADRSPTSATAAPGEEVSVTVAVDSDQQNIEGYNEEIVTGSAIANLTAGSTEMGADLSAYPTDAATFIYPSGAVDADTVTVTAEVAENASDGDTIELSGSVLKADGNETDAGTTTIEVSQFSTAREPTETTAAPGSTVEVNIEAIGAGASVDVLEESVASDATDSLEVTDAAADTTDPVIADNGTSVSVVHTSPVEAVNLSYEVEVSESATDGATLNLTGSVTGADAEASTGTTTIEVQENPYANEQGDVDTGGLVQAIQDWRTQNLGTTELVQIIQQWRG